MDKQSKAQAALGSQLSEIGERYLKRTLSEMSDLGNLLAQAEQGEAAALVGIQQLAHRIHGSGAMFGFDALSDAAGSVEHLLVTEDGSVTTLSPELLAKLRKGLEALDVQARTVAKSRNL